MGVSKNKGTPKWMVYKENPIKMDDLGVPLFSETFIFLEVLRMQNPLVFARFRGAICALKSHLDSPPSFCQSSETGSRLRGGPTSFFHTNVVPPSPTEPPPDPFSS